MQTLQIGSMPCVYTDDEFRQVLKRAESGGNAIDEEVRKFFADGESQLNIVWRKRGLIDLNLIAAWYSANMSICPRRK